MTSTVVKHSIVVDGRKTSITLEDPFWAALKEIARSSKLTLSSVISRVKAQRMNANLSSALRVFILQHFRGEESPLAGNRIAELSHDFRNHEPQERVMSAAKSEGVAG